MNWPEGVSVDRLRGEVDHLFGQLLGPQGPWSLAASFGGGTFPALNVWEDEQSLFAEAELPGLKMDQLEIFVRGNELTVKGERTDGQAEKNVYHRRERGVGPFSRVIRLPVEVDADKVEASLQAGVLTVKLPKAPAARMRKIEVKAGS